MLQKGSLSGGGYSLVELIVASLLSVVLLTAATALFKPSLDISVLLGQKAAVQQNARLALESITREIGMAGSGIPGGGIPTPSGTGAVPAKFACDQSRCYVSSNLYSDYRVYALTPGDGKGAVVNGVATDVVTFAYRDMNSNLDQYPVLNVDSSSGVVRVWFDSRTDPPWKDSERGARVGDVLLFCNINGCVAGAVTGIYDDHVILDSGDPLAFNQPSAQYGSLPTFVDPSLETWAFRILVVTYFIDASNPDTLRLMRQAGAHPPSVAAFNIENLQFSYDIFDENSAVNTSNLADANGRPNQIRKVNISAIARSPVQNLNGQGYQRVVLTTSVSTRNLIFRGS